MRLGYHDLHITTPTMERTSIVDFPFRVSVMCTRVGGWEVWANAEGPDLKEELLAGEYHTGGLRLDVAGTIIIDTLRFPQNG